MSLSLQFACLGVESVDLTTATHNITSEFLSEMTRRRHRIQRICNNTRNTLSSRDAIATSTLRDLAFARSLLFDTERRIVYCAVPKVASSSVKMAMALMTGRVDHSRPIDVHNSSYMARLGLTSLHRRLATAVNGTWLGLGEKLEPLKKFVVVRHPLRRVVSAYREKFERLNRYFHNRFGKLIVSR